MNTLRHSNVAHRLHSHAKNHTFAYDKKGKALFHKLAKAALTEVGLDLGHNKSTVRSNLGGVAVSGEITLHTDRIYIQISRGVLGKSKGIMFRSVKCATDHYGGPNHFTSLQALAENYEETLDKFRRTARPEY
jgi:hypothetical protein